MVAIKFFHEGIIVDFCDACEVSDPTYEISTRLFEEVIPFS
jgi:hypothetical protein